MDKIVLVTVIIPVYNLACDMLYKTIVKNENTFHFDLLRIKLSDGRRGLFPLSAGGRSPAT